MGFIAVIAGFALVLQLWLMLKNGPALGIRPAASVVNFLSFFTVLSNLIVAISLSISLLGPWTRAGRFFSAHSIQSAIMLYIFIVGLVYNLVLRNLWAPKGQQLLADNLLHVVVPLLYIVYWSLFTPRSVLRWKDGFPWLIFPFVYLVYSLIRGAATGWYPYPFLNADALGYSKVILNILMMIGAFFAVGLLLIAVNRGRKRNG